MMDLNSTDGLLHPSVAWSDPGAENRGEARSFAPPSDETRPSDDEAFRRQVVASIPALRAFARGLCGDAAAGDDLAQDALLNDLRNALSALSDEQRQAAIPGGAGGFSHRQAADMCDVPEGTMKSRACRARARLATLLETGDLEYDAAPASLAASLIMAELSSLSAARG